MHQDPFARWVEDDTHFASTDRDQLVKHSGAGSGARSMDRSGPGQSHLQQQQPVTQAGSQQVSTSVAAGQNSAAATATGRVSLDASLRSSAARRPRSTGAPGSQKSSSDAAAAGVSVLFDHYLSMIPQQQVAFDKPKGLLSKSFVSLLCPPTDLLDVQHITRAAIYLTVLAAQAVVFFSFVWVPAWLYFVWRTVQSSDVFSAQHHLDPAHTWVHVLRTVLPLTLPVVLLALASERLTVFKEARDKARRRHLVRADSLRTTSLSPAYSSQQPSAQPTPVRTPPAAAAQQSRGTATAAAGSTGLPGSSSASQSTSSAVAGRPEPAPGAKTQPGATQDTAAAAVVPPGTAGTAARPPPAAAPSPPAGGLSQARSSEAAVLVQVPIQEVGKQPAAVQPLPPPAASPTAARASTAAQAAPTTPATPFISPAAPPGGQPPQAQQRPPPPPSEDPAVKEVRGLLIQLERVLYGNELTEGLLPLDTLPQRVKKVCEDVGVEAAGQQQLSASAMLGLLQQARSIVGA